MHAIHILMQHINNTTFISENRKQLEKVRLWESHLSHVTLGNRTLEWCSTITSWYLQSTLLSNTTSFNPSDNLMKQAEWVLLFPFDRWEDWVPTSLLNGTLEQVTHQSGVLGPGPVILPPCCAAPESTQRTFIAKPTFINKKKKAQCAKATSSLGRE